MLPRDLFNEANLLKCMGKLIMDIEDGLIPQLTYTWDGECFDICQNQDSGDTYVVNIDFFMDGVHTPHFRPLNSRESWPIYFLVDDTDFRVFEGEGKVTLEGILGS